MSYNKDTTAIEKIYDYLRKMSPDMGGGETASGDGRRLYQQPARYARVPSRPALSVSTTSTSLATTCGSQATLAAHAYLPVPRADDPDDVPSSDDDERAPFKFTAPHKPITTKDRNLRNFGQSAMASVKCQEGTINGDASPYKPTTHKIYLVTQMLATLAVSCGSMVVGYSSAYTSPALVTMMSENSTLNTMTPQQASWVGGIMPLTALGGGIVGGLLIELIGRRTTLIVIAAPFVLSWMLIANSVNVAMLLVGRAICGFCVGIGSLAFPVYLGETLQPEVRGALGIVPTCFGNIGILVCFIAGKYFDWSGLAFIGSALPFLFIALMLLIPETPRWFVSKGQNDKAESSLRWLRGKDADIDSELHELLHVNNESASLLEIVSDKKYIRAVLISLGLMFFQQMSGINAVIFYTVQIFHDAGSDSIDENTCTIIVGIVNFASTFIASFLIDRLGRKVLLYISSVSMIVTLSALGAFFFVKSRGYDVSAFGWLPLASFVVYVIGFSCGFGPIPWLMMGEILPSKIRGVAASICTGFNWTCTFVVTKMFADMVYLMGTHGTFWTFGVLCFFALLFVIFFVPETRGRTLEDIELKLTGKKKAALNSNNC